VPRHRRAERHGHEDHREQRDPGQRQRPAQRPREHVGDRAPARRAPEIAASETLEALPEARARALLETEVGPRRGDGRRRGAALDEAARRIARQRLGQEEDGRGDERDREDRARDDDAHARRHPARRAQHPQAANPLFSMNIRP
jgi:hypothetical protein